MSFNDYFGKWSKFLDENELNQIMKQLSSVRADMLCPAFTDIFKAFQLCSFDKLKVIMLGMDPYPQKGIATGLLFGNKKETSEKNLSPSLQVIKDACIDWTMPHSIIDFDITLESWAEQGVLLLNSALTTEVGKPGSHSMLWRAAISGFLKRLSNEEYGLIFVLFGEQAKTFKPYINDKYNYILEEKHPAYYARIQEKMPPEIFNKINFLVMNLYGETINFYKEEKNES